MSGVKKDIFITFYQKENNTLFISNGFSFGREKSSHYIDLFISRDASTEEVKKKLDELSHPVNRVLVSISMQSEFDTLNPLMRENWVMGGNVFSITDKKTMITNKIKGELTSLPLEKYLQGPNASLSNQFDHYFDSLIQQTRCREVYYNCSIGRGCYWKKCSFCGYHTSNNKNYVRSNLKNIFSSIPPNKYGGTSQVHLGLAATPPSALKEILDFNWDKSIIPVLFLRADPDIIDVLMTYNPTEQVCERKRFCLGVEILSDSALKILKKGTTVKNILQTIELLLRQGGFIELEIMSDYPFLDNKILQEAKTGYSKLKKIIDNYAGPKNFIWIYNNGTIRWPTRQKAASFSGDVIEIPPLHEHFNEFNKNTFCANMYSAYIAKNSPMDKNNNDLNAIIAESGIQVFS